MAKIKVNGEVRNWAFKDAAKASEMAKKLGIRKPRTKKVTAKKAASN